KDPKTDRSKLHVSFLSAAPAPERLKKLEALPTGRDEYRASGKAIYLHCPDGYGRSKLANNALERALEVRATTRNWRTVTALAEMAAG
ncbi:MAG TPA: hypothetical protein VMS88_01035, partial [Terriglobales bacterium]|nr:hypothetical protein [Terriglobales bacterium]